MKVVSIGNMDIRRSIRSWKSQICEDWSKCKL